MAKKRLNEGMIDKIAQGIFKLIFSSELGVAANYINRINAKLTDQDRKELQASFKKMEDSMKKVRQLMDNM